MSKIKEEKTTPLIEQYLSIKKDYPDAILFFRLGDFYELFFDDAIAVSKLLELTLTKKSANIDIPMCGMPYHSVNPYIKKLVDNGYKVAIAEQVSEPGRGLVKREVIKVITPGQVLDDGILESSTNNYIAAISFLNLGYYLAYSDISTGENYLKYPLTVNKLIAEIENLNIKEVILFQDFDEKLNSFLNDKQILINKYTNNKISNDKLLNNLTTQDEKLSSSLLINYLKETQKTSLTHLLPFNILKDDIYLYLDNNFFKHMEIFLSNDGNEKDTLFNVLNKTKTAFGTRLLKHIMLNPLNDFNEITKRQNIISELSSISLITNIQDELAQIYDINRIVARSNTNNISPLDIVWLKRSLAVIPKIKDLLISRNSKILKDLAKDIDSHDNLYKLLNKAILEDPNKNITQGGIIKDGFLPELDNLRDISKNNDKWLRDYEEKEKEKTGIKNLKVGFNSVFGYYIEISKGALVDAFIPENYERKQTLKTGERFISPELKERELLILNIEDKINNLEYETFKEIRKEVNKNTLSLQVLAKNISYIDIYTALALVAIKNNYVKPELSKDYTLEIIGGRHPVVEHYTKIIENDALLNKEEIKIITGPNMGGKSTYMRMIALIIYLSLIGSFVPAESAKIPLYDKIFTRIGASDNIASGQSTFMVEMLEAQNAITNATDKSILFFDEIGRGTATYDGMSLAYGILEYIVTKVKSQMFFSTHYHETTVLEDKYKNIKNVFVDATFKGDEIVFLYKVKKGSISNSYGLNVALLAGMPSGVLNIAKQYLVTLEKDSNKKHEPLVLKEAEQTEDLKSYYEFKEELKNINLDKMTPFDALIFLKKWQDK